MEHKVQERESFRRGAFDIRMSRWTDFRCPLFCALPWRERVAWRIRLFADWVDGWVSQAYTGTIPAECTAEDQWDAMYFGLAASHNYLADLAAERRVRGP
jgi:hypothetical protein